MILKRPWRPGDSLGGSGTSEQQPDLRICRGMGGLGQGPAIGPANIGFDTLYGVETITSKAII